MTLLDQFYASGGKDVAILTLELTCPAWDAPVLICNGFEDQVCVTEDARTLTFIAAAIDVSLPKKSNQGSQSLNFAIDNITGEAQLKIDEALEAEARVSMTFRIYLESDKSAPAEAPYRFSVQSGQMQGNTVQISAGFFDAINTGFPRDLYTTNFAPGIKYL